MRTTIEELIKLLETIYMKHKRLEKDPRVSYTAIPVVGKLKTNLKTFQA